MKSGSPSTKPVGNNTKEKSKAGTPVTRKVTRASSAEKGNISDISEHSSVLSEDIKRKSSVEEVPVDSHNLPFQAQPISSIPQTNPNTDNNVMLMILNKLDVISDDQKIIKDDQKIMNKRLEDNERSISRLRLDFTTLSPARRLSPATSISSTNNIKTSEEKPVKPAREESASKLFEGVKLSSESKGQPKTFLTQVPTPSVVQPPDISPLPYRSQPVHQSLKTDATLISQHPNVTRRASASPPKKEGFGAPRVLFDGQGENMTETRMRLVRESMESYVQQPSAAVNPTRVSVSPSTIGCWSSDVVGKARAPGGETKQSVVDAFSVPDQISIKSVASRLTPPAVLVEDVKVNPMFTVKASSPTLVRRSTSPIVEPVQQPLTQEEKEQKVIEKLVEGIGTAIAQGMIKAERVRSISMSRNAGRNYDDPSDGEDSNSSDRHGQRDRSGKKDKPDKPNRGFSRQTIYGGITPDFGGGDDSSSSSDSDTGNNKDIAAGISALKKNKKDYGKLDDKAIGYAFAGGQHSVEAFDLRPLPTKANLILNDFDINNVMAFKKKFEILQQGFERPLKMALYFSDTVLTRIQNEVLRYRRLEKA